MTHVSNSPEDFADQALNGLCKVAAPYVRRAPGGVVRAHPARAAKVAVVVGGGSGHYPAFAGLVGQGLADGAVCGNVFASPSTRQVIDVCRAADRGAGVWLSFGNYAGDVLNFGAAATRLRAQGMDVAVLAVTDDVASAPADQCASRRGVAGDLVVFKIAGAAAEEGMALAEVAAVAARANDRTRSFGVAFDGCTLPGADHPLFRLPEGLVGWGLGIHGEPGVGEEPVPSASALAAEMVARVLGERPAGEETRAAVVLNGLGTVKYEELFVLWDTVAVLLAEAGVQVVAPEVGEFVTSLDMAGCSLTVTWLDDELERLWLAPADTPAFRRTAQVLAGPALDEDPDVSDKAVPLVAAGAAGAAAGVRALSAFEIAAATLHEHEEHLGQLDAVAGDGDHGRGMSRGVDAAVAEARRAVAAGADAPTVISVAAEAWADRAGGTSGALWGVALLALAAQLPTDADVTFADLAQGVREATAAVQAVGGAVVGDKTVVDALAPFTTALTTSVGHEPARAYAHAVEAARAGAESTTSIVARRGRARVLGDKSLGTPDPGATSFVLLLDALAQLVHDTTEVLA
ncbi:D-erythrulose kinase [Cellulomonas sp. WB94]|uniref:dihydroxyacetone kinase family protein n=1 Tax=Cellulomonas sp. WB94 TaxID=2173174 RepID=UPI000D563042|nr:dihydroxyacetone kinase family protein [Cellulomonas sp. WB94]PVU82229.1 D-erythrulose kinase [Cellulomonas sp. WB94]